LLLAFIAASRCGAGKRLNDKWAEIHKFGVMREAIIEAIGRDDLDTVQRLLSSRDRRKFIGSIYGRDLLFPAARSATDRIISYLLQVGCKPALLSGDGESILQSVIYPVSERLAQPEIDLLKQRVGVLVQHGALRDMSLEQRALVLRTSLENGWFPIAEQLDKLFHSKRDNSAELVGRIRIQDAAGVLALLNVGANPSADALDGRTCLMLAAAAPDASITSMLLKHGADATSVWSLRGHGQTALMIAALAGKADIVAALLESKAPTEARDLYGKTALHFASKYHHLATIRVLVNAGANVNAADKDGRTPLHFIADRPDGHELSLANDEVGGERESVQLLISHGASPHLLDRSGQSALQIANAWSGIRVYPRIDDLLR